MLTGGVRALEKRDQIYLKLAKDKLLSNAKTHIAAPSVFKTLKRLTSESGRNMCHLTNLYRYDTSRLRQKLNLELATDHPNVRK